jgi:predicted negative regulator of RcsB-dependent stress response
MATQHLDLEEQEQLDQLKHFWKQYGNLITWLLIAVLGAYAAWNGYQYWQRNQAAQASALYGEIERLAGEADPEKLERAFGDMKSRFGSTAYAMQGGLLVASALEGAGKSEPAKAALTWVAEKAVDPAYQAIARLRLAAVAAQAKDYTLAMAQLDASYPSEFTALVADRKGDVLSLQGKTAEARAEYEKAYKGLSARMEYRRLVEIKLAALGADPRPPSAVAAAGTAAATTESSK